MKKFLEDKREGNPDFALAEDGVHPNALGHWVMAREVLAGLGELEVAHAENVQEALSRFTQGQSHLKWVEDLQGLMKDAWLSRIGHQRPGMNAGLPLKEAYAQKVKMEEEMKRLSDH